MNWTETVTKLATTTHVDAGPKPEQIFHPAPYGDLYAEPYGARSSSRPLGDRESSPEAA